MDEHEPDAAVTVIAEYQAHAGRGDEVAVALARHVTATRAEPGCVGFTAYRDPDDPDHFALYERYADENAFQAHRQTAHFADYVEGRIAPLLQDRIWRRYEEIAAEPRSSFLNSLPRVRHVYEAQLSALTKTSTDGAAGNSS